MMYDANGQAVTGPNFGMGMGGYMPQGTGMQYNGFGQAPTVQRNVLNQEEISLLMKKENSFSLALNETDKLKAACNHRSLDGLQDALYEEEDGSVRCSICGYKFRPIDANMNVTTKESLIASCSEITDILQTIKMIWIDIDDKVAREYFQLIPLIDKIPELFEIAAKNFAKHGNINPWVNNNRNMGTLQIFNMLSGIINGQTPYQNPQQAAQPGFGAPQMGAPMMGQPMMGYANPMSNGFGYQGAAPMGYQPQTGDFATQYGTPQPAADPNAATQAAAPQAAQPDVAANTDPNAANFKA